MTLSFVKYSVIESPVYLTSSSDTVFKVTLQPDSLNTNPYYASQLLELRVPDSYFARLDNSFNYQTLVPLRHSGEIQIPIYAKARGSGAGGVVSNTLFFTVGQPDKLWLPPTSASITQTNDENGNYVLTVVVDPPGAEQLASWSGSYGSEKRRKSITIPKPMTPGTVTLLATVMPKKVLAVWSLTAPQISALAHDQCTYWAFTSC